MDHDRRHYKAAKALVGLVLDIVVFFVYPAMRSHLKIFGAIVKKLPKLVFILLKPKVKTSLI